VSEEARKAAAEAHLIQYYASAEEMLAKERLDAITICVPHPFHAPIAIEAMNRKIHVLCEKPLAVTVSQADAMVEAAEKNSMKLGVCFQQRTFPLNQLVARMIHEGEIGDILRVAWASGTMRTRSYFERGTGWRGTWKHEGGAVLLNQAPHTLDMFQWFVGMPEHVFARTATLLHDTEGEDAVSAVLDYANGAQAVFQANTIEFPGGLQYDICGTRGIISCHETLRIGRANVPVDEFIQESDQPFGKPECEWQPIEVPESDQPTGHAALVSDFARAIIEDRDPFAPGRQAVNSLELANAMILSSKRGKPVTLPIDRKEYDDLLAELIAEAEEKK